MTETRTRHLPTEINLHKKSRILAIAFDDGERFELPCEYLRVFSRSAETRVLDKPLTGKEKVNIDAIQPIGQYAVKLIFDDGHDTGIYSWDTLYDLGKNQKRNWMAYLVKLEEMGYKREAHEAGPKKVKLLYFSYLAQKYRRESEDLTLPETVSCVDDFIQFLSRRKPQFAPLLAPGQVRVTVNKQFAEGFTRLEDGDEIGLVPTSPFAPATPDL